MTISWSSVPLKEACQIKPPKKEARARLGNTDRVSFVPMNNLGVREKHFIPVTEKSFEKVSGSYTYFADGDVLLAKITPCFENGKLGIARNLANGVGFGSSEFFVLRPKRGLDSEYLFYYLSQDSFRDSGRTVMSGAVGHKRVPKQFIENHCIPLPPLSEQKRIVAILDEAFAGIDTAIANTEKNLANSHALFESYLNSTFSEENPDWDKVLLGELCEFENGDRGENYPNKSALVSDGIPFVNAGSVKDGAIQKDRISYITKERYDLLSRGKFHPGDVLFCLRGSIGKCGIVDETFEGGAIASSLVIVRPKDDRGKPRILPELIHSYFRSELCARMIESFAGGAAQPNLGAKDLAKFEITVPPKDEQQEIVDRLREFRRETARLQRIFRRKLNALEELKNSVLRKAFAGDFATEFAEQEVEGIGV